MNAAMIVIQYPTVESVLEMPLAQRDEEIQALPADRSHHTLANGICFGRSGRCPQYAYAHGGNRLTAAHGPFSIESNRQTRRKRSLILEFARAA